MKYKVFILYFDSYKFEKEKYFHSEILYQLYSSFGFKTKDLVGFVVRHERSRYIDKYAQLQKSDQRYCHIPRPYRRKSKEHIQDFLTGTMYCIRCITLLPPFFPKFEALFLKSDYLFMIQSTNRSIFLLLHKSGNAHKLSRVPSIETNSSQNEQRLESTAGGHFSVSKFVLTGFAKFGRSLSCF